MAKRTRYGRPVRIGVVGLGWVGQARHIPIIRASKEFELVGVADRVHERVAEFARKNQNILACQASSLAEIGWIENVDAISVATPPMAHHDLVCEGVSRGLHVITEKPFAMTCAEGEAMVAAAERCGCQLAVVHNFQFARAFQKLDQDLENGHLGSIRGIRAIQFSNFARRLPSWYEQLPLGLFYDESPHLLYLLARIAGPLELIKAVCVDGGHGKATPAQIDAWFRAQGVSYPVTMSCFFEASVSEWHLIVHGEHGMAIVDIFRDIYVFLPNDRAHGTADVIRTSLAATIQHWAQHGSSGLLHLLGKLRYGNEHIFRRFAEAVRGRSDAIALFNAQAALRTLRLQQDIFANCNRLSR